MSRNRGYRYGKDRDYGNKRKPKTGLAEFKNHTERTRKDFLCDYLFQWVDNPTPPQQGYILTPSGSRVGCFILCKLPYDCLAVYVDGRVLIAEGVNRDGSLRLMPGVEYSLNSYERLYANRLGTSMWESSFVELVRGIILAYYPDFR